jgi:uncharacterized protein (TIGR02118 family)
MIRMSVTYPSSDTSTFDHAYYQATHVPLVSATWKPLSAEIDKGVQGPNVAAVHMTFADMAAFQAAMADPGSAAILADVPNYTNIAPVIQVSEIVA